MGENSPAAGPQSPDPDGIEVRVGVNRLEEVSEPEVLSWERHNARRAALQAEFAPGRAFTVIDWGNTKDEEETHEFVSLLVLVASSEVREFAWEGMKWIAEEMAKHAVSEVVSGVIGGLIGKLLRRQKKNEIARFVITVGDVQVSISPEDQGGDQRLWLPGKVFFDNKSHKPAAKEGPSDPPAQEDA